MNRIMDINVDQSSNEVGFIHRHFNSDKKINSKNKILGRQSNNMYIRLLREAKTFRWFGVVSNFALKNNKVIINRSSFSMLDMFKR